MRIIGLGHYSRTGKDTFADFLMQGIFNRGLTAKKCPFAWKLKQITYELYAWAGAMPPEHYETESGQPDRNLKLVKMASEKYPEGPTIVDIWIDMGTPAVRKNVYDGTWIDYVLNTDHACDVLIIPDVRFPNEVQAIRANGGSVIKVVRPGVEPREGSVADAALLDYNGWDMIINNDQGLEHLEAEANSVAWDIYMNSSIGAA